MIEVWRPIADHEGRYEVSTLGRVRNVLAGRVLNASADGWGYRRVRIAARPGQKSRSHSIHVLVLAAFVGPRPEGMVSRHLDGDPANNELSNLAYGTQQQNMYDRIAHGNDPNANKTHCPSGHPYNVANTYVQPSDPRTRQCRVCNREAVARYAQRRREKVSRGSQ